MKQNDVVNNHFSSANISFFGALVNLSSKKDLFVGGFIKAILLLFLICALTILGCSKKTSDVDKLSKSSSVDVNENKSDNSSQVIQSQESQFDNSVNKNPDKNSSQSVHGLEALFSAPVYNTKNLKPLDFNKLLELYSVYSFINYSKATEVINGKALFEKYAAEEQIEKLMETYNGKSLDIPYDLSFNVLAEDNYDTKGIGLVITLPFRCYAKPTNSNKKTRVVFNNSSNSFVYNVYYVKISDMNLVQYVKSYGVKADWKYYNDTYIKENPYFTQLIVFYLDTEEIMKDIYKNSKDYKVQIKVNNLIFSRPKTFGYFRYKDLIENDYNTVPLYDNRSSYLVSKTVGDFQNPPEKVLFANIELISIINSKTNKEIIKIDFEKNCKTPEKLKVGYKIPFQSVPVENLSSVSIVEKQSLDALRPKSNKFSNRTFDTSSFMAYIDNLELSYNRANAFDKKKIKEEIDDIKKLAQGEFQQVFRIRTIYIPGNFNKNEARLFITTNGFRFNDNVQFNKHNINKVIISDSLYNAYYSNNSSCVKNELANSFISYYFCTDEKTLVPVKGSRYSEEIVKLEGGSLYYLEELFTTIALDVNASIEDMKDMYNNLDNYEAIIVYKDVWPMQLPYYGYFNEEALLKLDGDTRLLRLLEFSSQKEHIPYYFVTQMNKSTPSAVSAKIKSIIVINKNTQKVIAKADAKE